jgi:hypothetical protein
MRLITWIKHPILCLEAIKTKKYPVVNLDGEFDEPKNCKICGYDHQYKTKYNKKHYCNN